MSEEQAPPAAAVAAETPEAAPRVRRISNPRPKKAAEKSAEKTAEKRPAKAAATPVPAPEPAEKVEAAKSDAPTAATVTSVEEAQDWPDAETVSEGGGKNGHDKRKRRRRKGKGGGQGNQPQLVAAPGAPEESGSASDEEDEDEEGGNAPAPAHKAPAPVSQPQQQPQHQRQQHQPSHQNQHPQHNRQSVNAEQLAKRAWKIFLAEVSEEGVSLIGDQDARELSKRCFRLAEIFLDEQARRLR